MNEEKDFISEMLGLDKTKDLKLAVIESIFQEINLLLLLMNKNLENNKTDDFQDLYNNFNKKISILNNVDNSYNENVESIIISISSLYNNISKFSYLKGDKLINYIFLELLVKTNVFLIKNVEISSTTQGVITFGVNLHSGILKNIFDQDKVKLPFNYLTHYIDHINYYFSIKNEFLPFDKKKNTANFVMNKILPFALIVYNDLYFEDYNKFIGIILKQHNFKNLEELKNKKPEIFKNFSKEILKPYNFYMSCKKEFGNEIIKNDNQDVISIYEYFENKMNHFVVVF